MRELFKLETCIDSYYLVFDFYKINKGGEIQTYDHLDSNIILKNQLNPIV
jgi:hypothetical protein